MASRPKTKMPVSERAKQFLPFAAVAGLEDALARKERELGLCEKRELSEEMEEQLNEKLCAIQKGSAVTVTYFCNGEYRTESGIVEYVDLVHRSLWLEAAGTAAASFTHIGKGINTAAASFTNVVAFEDIFAVE